MFRRMTPAQHCRPVAVYQIMEVEIDNLRNRSPNRATHSGSENRRSSFSTSR